MGGPRARRAAEKAHGRRQDLAAALTVAAQWCDDGTYGKVDLEEAAHRALMALEVVLDPQRITDRWIDHLIEANTIGEMIEAGAITVTLPSGEPVTLAASKTVLRPGRGAQLRLRVVDAG